MEEEVNKSIGGLQVLRSTIVEKKNRDLLQAAQNWREGYSLTGLMDEDIQRIDWVLNIPKSKKW